MNRSTAPLKAAIDAVTLDTTHLDADGAFRQPLLMCEGRRFPVRALNHKANLALRLEKLPHFPRPVRLLTRRQRWFVHGLHPSGAAGLALFGR